MDEIRNKVLKLRERQVNIYECFKDYFGEELVDSTLDEEVNHDLELFKDGSGTSRNNIDIIVRFPKVTVTNEHNSSIEITELYAKITFTIEGKMFGDFLLLRSEYTEKQWCSDYMHSHINGASLGWKIPCMGTGPILNTVRRLRVTYNLDIVGLFCFELSKFVTVESLDGVPYRRLESVGNQGRNKIISISRDVNYNIILQNHDFYDIICKFISYYLVNNDLPTGFIFNNITIGLSEIQLWVKLSDIFVNWYNNIYDGPKLNPALANSILKSYYVEGNTIYENIGESRLNSARRLQGTSLFKFKGKDVTFNLIADSENTAGNNIVHLIDPIIVNLFEKLYLEITNYTNGIKQENFDPDKRVFIVF